MSGTTSGTVGLYSYPQRKVIEHALRRAGYQPEQASSEWIQIAQDLLFLQLSEYVNAGIPLWTRQYLLLNTPIGSPDVACPYGTVDVETAWWRILMPWRGAASTSTGADCSVLFGGQPNSDVTITATNPGVIVNFGSSTELDTVGVLLGTQSTVTAALQVQTSPDGTTWTTVQTLPSASYATSVWTYFDLSPSITAQYVKFVLPGASSWVLNQVQFGLANGQDIQLGGINVDDYYNLPNKQMQGQQPNTQWVDRNLDTPIIKVWPTASAQAFYAGTVTARVRRYIQDPGAMTNNLEIPLRWYEGVTARLACRLYDELPPPPNMDLVSAQERAQRYQRNQANATKAEALFWSAEKQDSPRRWSPNIRGYTR